MISEAQRLYYAGLWVLKKLDLSADDGGVQFPVLLPASWAPLEPVLEQLAVDSLVAIDRKKGCYTLTDAGLDLLGSLIDEAESFIDEFDDKEADVMVSELRRRNLDPLRVRFLWGWYQGEFDDLVVFQRRRGADPVQHDWASYLIDGGLYDELARDLDA